MSFGYDEEAIYQDADILQAEYEREADRFAARRAQGYCTHGHGCGKGDGEGPMPDGSYYPEQVMLEPGEYVCTAGCGTVYADDDEFYRATSEGDLSTVPRLSRLAMLAHVQRVTRARGLDLDRWQLGEVMERLYNEEGW